MPPVTNTGIPALCAAIIVPDTVVPPDKPCQGTVTVSTQGDREKQLQLCSATQQCEQLTSKILNKYSLSQKGRGIHLGAGLYNPCGSLPTENIL